MRIALFRVARLMLLTMSVAACSKRHGEATPDTPAGSKPAGEPTAMKDMTGMAAQSARADSSDDGSAPNANAIAFTAAQVQHGNVRWQAVSLGTVAGTASVPAQVVPNEDRTARLGAPAAGRVIAVRVSPGDRVSRGQILVTLQSPEAGMAQSDVAKAGAAVTAAEAQAAYAKSARDRAERLLALKAIPRQEYERAIADDAQARSTLTQAEAELRRARSTAGQLGAGASASGMIEIRSPFTGVVLTRTAVPGTVVEAGSPLVVVTDPASLWVTVNAPEALAGLFRRGSSLRFIVPAYPADTFTARVQAVGAGLDPETRTLPVRAVVPSGGKLKPAMLATAYVVGAGSVTAVLLPAAAVQLMEGKPTVFLAQPDGNGGARFTRREVEVGLRNGASVAVIRGLANGDVVVTAGAFAVKAQIQKGSKPAMEM